VNSNNKFSIKHHAWHASQNSGASSRILTVQAKRYPVLLYVRINEK